MIGEAAPGGECKGCAAHACSRASLGPFPPPLHVCCAMHYLFFFLRSEIGWATFATAEAGRDRTRGQAFSAHPHCHRSSIPNWGPLVFRLHSAQRPAQLAFRESSCSFRCAETPAQVPTQLWRLPKSFFFSDFLLGWKALCVPIRHTFIAAPYSNAGVVPIFTPHCFALAKGSPCHVWTAEVNKTQTPTPASAWHCPPAATLSCLFELSAFCNHSLCAAYEECAICASLLFQHSALCADAMYVC